jgi:hypothetical protein
MAKIKKAVAIVNEKRATSNLRKVLLILFLVAIFLCSFNQISSSDPFLHIKTGEVILSSGTIPHADIYLSSAIGNLWVTHEWLSEIIIYLIYLLAGFWGLIIFVSLLATLTYYILLRIAERHGANLYVSICIFLIVGQAGSVFWIPRPQVLVFLLFALLLYCLDAFERTSKRKYLPLLCVIIWVWANISSSVILGLLIFGLFFGMALIRNLKDRSPSFPYFGAALAIAVELSFINPNSWRTLVYSLTIMPALKTLSISEWQPITTFLWDRSIDFYIAEILIIAAFLVLKLGLKKESRNLSWLFLALGASLMPFMSSRHLIFWSLAVLPPLAWLISKALEKSVIAQSKTAATIAGIVAVVFIGFHLASLPNSPVNKKTLPVEAADFLAENNVKGNIFNLYETGDYLLWRIWPNVKVFIDGRSEVIAGTPLKEYLAIKDDDPSANFLIDKKYGFGYFVLPGDQTQLKSIWPLIQSLTQKGWWVVFWNDTSIVMARNDAANADVIAQYGLKYVGPFTIPQTIPESNAVAADQEIKKLITRFPDSVSIKNYAQSFEESHTIPINTSNQAVTN